MRFFVLLLSLMVAVPTFASDESDREAIDGCLNHWGKHPFGKSPKFRIIAGKVKVMGTGEDVDDGVKTEKPELVLVKPNVAVMSKSTLRLMNPNGWYCLKGRVAVMGKTEVDLACKASLASSSDGATVMGGGEQNGVTVMGSSQVNKIGCVQ